MTTRLKNIELILTNERQVAESIVLDMDYKVSPSVNVFERSVAVSSLGKIDTGIAAALAGLRASVILSKPAPHYLRELQQAVSQFIPILIYLPQRNRIHIPGSFSWEITSGERLHNISLMARKVSEICLTPSIIYYPETFIPSAEYWQPQKIRTYLGQPEDRIDTAFTSHKLIFGTQRRRVPDYFNLNSGELINAKQSISENSLQVAGRKVFFEKHHYQTLLQEQKFFESHFGAPFDFIEFYHRLHSSHLIFAIGKNYKSAVNFLGWKPEYAKGVNVISPILSMPVQDSRMVDFIKKASTVTILCELDTNQEEFAYYVQLIKSHQPKVTVVQGFVPTNSEDPDLSIVFENATKKAPNLTVYCNLTFNRNTRDFPNMAAATQEILSNYPEVKDFGGKIANPISNELFSRRPLTLRQIKAGNNHFRDLSYFINEVTETYQQEEPIVATPLRSLNIVPSGTSLIINRKASLAHLPSIQTENCTGCGSCFRSCPYGAIHALSFAVNDLLNAVADRLAAEGNPIGKLKPQLKNLATVAHQELKNIREQKQEFNTDTWWNKSFGEFIQLTGATGEKEDAFKEDFKKMLPSLLANRRIITEKLFDNFEEFKNGTGELLTISFDPSTCTGCDICSNSCPEDAIKLQEVSSELIKNEENNIVNFSFLPSTKPDIIKHLLAEREEDPFDAMYLSSRHQHLLGTTLHSDVEIRQTIHAFLSIADETSSIQNQDLLSVSDTLIVELQQNIHSHLVESIPTQSFVEIQKAIKSTSENKTSLSQLITREALNGQINTRELERKIDLLEQLQKLKEILENGLNGKGRAGYGIVLSEEPAFNFLREYPVQPFNVPVLASSSLSSCEGLYQSMHRQTLDYIRLLRRAKLEAKDKYQPAIHDNEIIKLTDKQLTDQESSWLPAVLFIGSWELLQNQNNQSVTSFLNAGKRIRSLFIQQEYKHICRRLPDLVHWAHRTNGFIYQGVLGANKSLYKGFINGFKSQQSALFSILVPGTDNEISRKSRASQLLLTRAWPIITAGFTENMERFIDLKENPNFENPWVTQSITDQKPMDYQTTIADYLFFQPEYIRHYSAVSDRTEHPTFTDFTASNATNPCIIIPHESGNDYFQTDAQIIKMVVKSRNNWILLRKIAGFELEISVPWKKELELQIETEINKEKQRLEQEFNVRLEEALINQKIELKNQVKQKLIDLSIAQMNKVTE